MSCVGVYSKRGKGPIQFLKSVPWFLLSLLYHQESETACLGQVGVTTDKILPSHQGQSTPQRQTEVPSYKEQERRN